MRRIERLINLIAALLEADRPMTAEEIRSGIAGYDQPNIDAFRRAFERDKEALRAMGIPLELRKTDPFAESADGYTIPKAKYYLPQLDLEPDELAALAIAAEAALGTEEDAAAGLLKLSIEEPPLPGRGPRLVWGADLAAEQPLLTRLHAALLERAPVEFEYRGAGSERAAVRTVEPYALVHRRGHWYLVGRDVDRSAVRSFKLSRIVPPVKALEGSYDIPPSFDAESHIGGEAWELGPDGVAEAVVRFDSSMRWWAEQNMARAEISDGPGGALDARIPVSNVDALVSWVIGLGTGVEIISPESARARLIEHLSPYLDTGIA